MSMTSCHDKEIRSLTPSGINVNNMAWLAVDKDGTEKIFSVKPFRGNTQEDESHVWGTYVGENYWRWYPQHDGRNEDTGYAYYKGHFIELPVGTISTLIGRKLSWTDEPVELKEKDSYEQKNNKVQYQKWFWSDHILITDSINNASVQVAVFNQQELKDEYHANALIYALYVDESCRKRGIGKGLLEQAERLAHDHHCRVVALEWEEQATPRWTLEWYLRQGYKDTRLGTDCTLLVKDLRKGGNDG